MNLENILRPVYLEKIRPYYKHRLIKVLTGQRRVGKSQILSQIKNELQNLYPQSNFIFIDKEKFEFDEITDYKTLIDYVKSKSISGQNFVFIDEIQEIASFEKALRSLLSDKNYDIYCTGSNAQIFSGELATILGGRQISIKIHALSYPEFIHFHQLENTAESLNMFMKYGGLPYLIHLPKDDKVIFDYLNNVLSTILYRDVIGRHQIRDTPFLNNLLKFTANNIGGLLSARNISDYLKSQLNSKSTSVVINYLHFLTDAGIINQVGRMDIQGLKLFESSQKYFFEDVGLRNAILGFRPGDINRILENIIYNHLIYNGYNVFTGKSGEKEIDFIAEKNNERIYVQVALNLLSEKTIQREFGNLDEIKDHYPKYVVTMDSLPVTTSYKGIKHVELREFLINEI